MAGIGSLLGTGVGVVAGALIPGAQPFLPALAALGGSLGGGIEGMIDSSKANKMELPLTDPMQVDYLSTLKRKQRSLETGALYQPQQDIIKQAGAKATSNVLKLTGGDIGASVSAINAVNRSTGRNLNELYGQMGLEGLKMSSMIGDLVDKISQRKLEVQAYQKAQAKTGAAQEKQDALQNAMALAARNPQFGEWLKKLLGGNQTGIPPLASIGVGNSPALTGID